MMTDEGYARLYISKIQGARNRGIDFTLSFAEFKRLCQVKTCTYTGIRLTKSNGDTRATDRTIDRIDHTRGYEPGNVVACCHSANQLKSFWESEKNPFSFDDIERMVRNLRSLQK